MKWQGSIPLYVPNNKLKEKFSDMRVGHRLVMSNSNLPHSLSVHNFNYMIKIFKLSIPYFFILFGLLLLFILSQPIPAGISLLLGVVMIIERIWPEKWEKEKKSC